MSAFLGQAAFVSALFDPEQATPSELTSWNGSDPGQRFGVYRNNVIVSLVDALCARFPVVLELVGEEFFRATARLFVLNSPPQSRIMARYGETFPSFLDSFPPAQDLGYLGDVARLEAARTRAYHAADTPTLSAAAFADIEPDALMDVRVVFHPSVAVVNSEHAVFSIWAAHQGAISIEDVQTSKPEGALVYRPSLDVLTRKLSPSMAHFLLALTDGRSLSDAVAPMGDHSDFNLTDAFALLLNGDVLISLIRDGD